MRLSFALLVVALAGCGQSVQPTPHEKYVAAAAEFDCEHGKLTELVAANGNSEFKARAIYEFFSHSDPMPVGVYLSGLMAGSKDGGYAYGRYYQALPEIIAMRKKAEVVGTLRRKAEQAHLTWMESANPAGVWR